MMLELILFIILFSPGVSNGTEKPSSCSVNKYYIMVQCTRTIVNMAIQKQDVTITIPVPLLDAQV